LIVYFFRQFRFLCDGSHILDVDVFLCVPSQFRSRWQLHSFKKKERRKEEDKGDESVRRNFEEEEMKETRYENTQSKTD
jgi:hypothetical protein